LLLKHIHGLSDEGVCERWIHDPYFQHFTGDVFSSRSFIGMGAAILDKKTSVPTRFAP
jgi:hypothetical protein